MNTFRNRPEPSNKLARPTFGLYRTKPFTIAFVALTLCTATQSQEPPRPAESVAEAARNVREQKANSTKHAKVFTNDELGGPYLAPSIATPSQGSAPTNVVETPKPPSSGCDNPDAERLKADLQAAQEEQDQLRRQLSYNPAAISSSDVDMRNFKPGSSGLNVGGTPHIETQPPSAARLEEVSLDEKVASLTRTLRLACDSPGEAQVDSKLDEAEQRLSLLQRQFDLDQNVFYSQTNYAADTAGKANLDAEQQQIQDLQSEIERLKDELAASKTNPPST